MSFGERIQIRADRWFEYKRAGLSYCVHEGTTEVMWQFRCLGIWEGETPGVYETVGCGYVNGVLLSAMTEAEAVEELRNRLMHLSEEYDNSHWEIELVGIDVRPYGSDKIVYESYAFM